ncbi:MAG: hypothetical protein MJ252_00625 [archaeon]|nr:hypothetical protein [archaeon]
MNINFYIPLKHLNQIDQKHSPLRQINNPSEHLTKLTLPANFLCNLLSNRQKKKTVKKIYLNNSITRKSSTNNTSNFVRNFSGKADSNKSDHENNRRINTEVDNDSHIKLENKLKFRKFLSSNNKLTLNRSKTKNENDKLKKENQRLKEENLKLREIINTLTSKNDKYERDLFGNLQQKLKEENFEELLFNIAPENKRINSKEKNILRNKPFEIKYVDNSQKNKTLNSLTDSDNDFYYEDEIPDYSNNTKSQIEIEKLMEKTKGILNKYDSIVNTLLQNKDNSNDINDTY